MQKEKKKKKVNQHFGMLFDTPPPFWKMFKRKKFFKGFPN